MYIPSTKSQRGMTMMSMIFLLGSIAVVVLLILKILPLYIEHGKIVSILENLKSEEGIELKIEPEVRTILKKRFNMDDIVSATSEDITIVKSGNSLSIDVDYQAVAPLAGNVSLTIDFADSVEIGR